MDRLTSIRIFISAVNGGSFAAASRQFGLSAAMAGKYVSAIEADLNARLLERTTRRLTLTAAGEIYYERCKRILEAYDEANREVTGNQGSAHGILRIVAPVTFGSMHLGGVIATYLEAHPQVNVEMSMSDRYVDLVREGVDCVLRVGTLADSDMVVRRLATLEEVTLAAPGYIERFGLPERWDRLAGHRMVGFHSSALGGVLPLEFLVEGARRTVMLPHSLTVTGASSYGEAARLGLGLIQAPRYGAESDLAAGRLVALLTDTPPSPSPVSLLYPKGRLVPPRLRVFIDWVAARFADQAGASLRPKQSNPSNG